MNIENDNLNICQAADDIIEIFEQQGFTTDVPVDIELLRHSIVDAIENRMGQSDILSHQIIEAIQNRTSGIII